jgi:hypothetical protein
MKIISFAWTTPALLAGSKCVTRREWDKKYAESFEAGEYVQAFDKSPRAGGKCVAIIELTQKPYLQGMTGKMKASRISNRSARNAASRRPVRSGMNGSSIHRSYMSSDSRPFDSSRRVSETTTRRHPRHPCCFDDQTRGLWISVLA